MGGTLKVHLQVHLCVYHYGSSRLLRSLGGVELAVLASWH